MSASFRHTRRADDWPAEQPRVLLHRSDFPPPLLDLQLTTHPRGWDSDPHAHDFWQLVFNRAGVAGVRAPDAAEIPEGGLAVTPPGVPHAWRNAGTVPLVLLNIHLAPGLAGFGEMERYLRALGGASPRLHWSAPIPRVAALAERLLAEMEGCEHAYRLRCTGIVADLLTTLFREELRPENANAASERAARIGETLAYIEEHAAEPLRLADIARRLHVSPKHACALFRKETGLSPMQRLLQARVDRARALLDATTLSVKAIAFATGFRDEHYFSRLFRKRVGVSPAIYRRRSRT